MISILGNKQVLEKILKSKVRYIEEPMIGIYDIKSVSKDDLSLTFYVSTHEDWLSLSLHYKQSGIFYIHLKYVKRFVAIENKIEISNGECNIIVTTQPCYSVTFIDEAKNLSQSRIRYDATDMLELFSVLPQITSTGSIFRLENIYGEYKVTAELAYKTGQAHFILQSEQYRHLDIHINNIENYFVDIKSNRLMLLRGSDQFNIDLTQGFAIDHSERETFPPF